MEKVFFIGEGVITTQNNVFIVSHRNALQYNDTLFSFTLFSFLI